MNKMSEAEQRVEMAEREVKRISDLVDRYYNVIWWVGFWKGMIISALVSNVVWISLLSWMKVLK